MGKLSKESVLSKPAGRHADGDGLYLLVKPSGSKTWVLRVQADGKRRDIGLGTLDVVRQKSKTAGPGSDAPILKRKMLTLAEARQKAEILRRAAKDGLDPVKERDRVKEEIPTFSKAAKAAHEALKSGWTEKGAKTFLTSLENHAFPTLKDVTVDQITAANVTAVLEPIWVTKPDMARKVRQRIGMVLNFSHMKGWRATEAPGKSVKMGLSHQPRGTHYKSMPYADVPAFVKELRAQAQTKGRRALLLHILTAARGGEVRRARWGQIDFAARDWNRPAEIMKGRDAPAHTVTLNTAAIDLLNEIKGDRTPDPADLIFPGERGALISDMTMGKVLKTAKRDYHPHGFRSTFRVWAAEQMKHVPAPVAEAAISHIERSQVVRAYLRTTYKDDRRELLEAWGKFVMSAVRAPGADQ